MIISHKNHLKYVFVHVPKTGGTSMKQILFSEKFKCDECGWVIEEKYNGALTNKELFTHASAKEIINYLNKNQYNSNEYFKFGFIRNPWDMVASNFEYYKQKMSKLSNLPPEEQIKVDASQKSFLDFLNATEKASGWFASRIFTNNKLNLDFVGKFENIIEDSQIIFKKILGINYEYINLPHSNATIRKHYKYYYNNTTKKIVEKQFSKIIKLGKYEFDEPKIKI